jgi:hypothetical protein
MPLVLVGIIVTGLCMALYAAEVFPTLLKWWRRGNKPVPRLGPKARTIITINEEIENGECRSIETDD